MREYNSPVPDEDAKDASADGNGNGLGRVDAVAAIRDMILRGDLKPGQRLPPERELAAQLGLSRSSVREAIRSLSALNILVSRRGAGTYVTALTDMNLFGPLEMALHVDPASLLHLIELRRMLEPSVAAAAAMNVSDTAAAQLEDQLGRYRDVVEELGREYADHLWAEAVAIDERIHELIAEIHGNPLVIAILASLRQVSRSQRRVTVVIPKARAVSLDEIEAVVEALQGRDSLRAYSAMMRHLASTEHAARGVLVPRLERARRASRDDGPRAEGSEP